MKKTIRKNEKGITLIALVITVIVLIILAAISIMMISGNDGILSRTSNASAQSDIAGTKEKIKLELIGKYDNGGKYTNADVITAVKNVTGNDVQIGEETVLSKKGNEVNISDLWQQAQIAKELKISYQEEETESKATALKVSVSGAETYEEYAREYIKDIQDGPDLIKIYVDGYNYNNDSNSSWDEITGGTYSSVEAYYEENYGILADYSDYIDFMVKQKVINLKEFLNKKVTSVTCNGQTEKMINEYVEFGISLNGEYEIVATAPDGGKDTKKAQITKCKTEKFSTICDTNQKMTIDNYEVTIPAGFAYGTSDNVNSVNNGFVITDSVDKDGNSTGNEFVWIPVKKDDLTVGNTGKKMAKLIENSESDYQGIFYSFSGTTSSEQNITNTNYREPDVIEMDADNGLEKNLMQKDYNDMIANIKKYGGFYVSRYEIGTENGKVISKVGVAPITSADKISKTWYGLYTISKTYKNTKNSVTSYMIWGSQAEAVLNFALEGNDKLKVDSVKFGNYTNKILKSGLTRTSDKINNIYDLSGNFIEWTVAAYSNTFRAYRGGWYEFKYPAKMKSYGSPDRVSPDISSRITLHIN